MAEEIAKLKVLLEGDSSDLERAISSVEKQLDKMGDKIGKISSSTSKTLDILSRDTLKYKDVVAQAMNMLEQKNKILKETEKAYSKNSKSIKEVGNAINSITQPLYKTSTLMAAGSIAAVKFALDFEKSFAKVKDSIEGTPAELEAIRQGIIDLSTTGINGGNAIPKTTAELNELASTVGKLKIEAKNILEFTEVMAQMDLVTNITGEEGATTLTRFMNVMGVGENKVRNIASAIVDLGHNGTATEADIASLALSMSKFGNAVGMSAADVLGYSSALSNLGISAQSGGNSIGEVWLEIEQAVSSGGEKLEAFAKISGKTAEDFKEQWGVDAKDAFNSLLKGSSESDISIKSLMGLGVKDIQATQTISTLSKEYDLVADNLSHANSAYVENIALQEEANNEVKRTDGNLVVLSNNIVESGRSIGQSLTPTVNDVTSDIIGFSEKVASLDDTSKEGFLNIGSGLISVGSAAASASSDVSKLDNDFSALDGISFSGALGEVKNLVSAYKLISDIVKEYKNETTEEVNHPQDSDLKNVLDTAKTLAGYAATVKTLSSGVKLLTSGSAALSAVAGAAGIAFGWLLVPAGMAVGMQVLGNKLEESRQEFLRVGEGAKTCGEEAKRAFSTSNDVDLYAKKLNELNEIIKKGSDGTPEGDSNFNAALEERKKYMQWFIDNYGEYAYAMGEKDDTGLPTEIPKETMDRIKSDANYKKNQSLQNIDLKLEEGGNSINGLKENISSLEDSKVAITANNSALNDLVHGLRDLQTEYNALDDEDSGGNSEKLDQIKEKYSDIIKDYEKLTLSDFQWGKEGMIDSALEGAEKRIEENEIKFKNNTADIKAAENSINEYQGLARMANEIIIGDMSKYIGKDAEKVQEYIGKIGDYGEKVGLSFNEMGGYANQTALKLNGFESATEAAADGTEAMSNTVQNCVDTMQQWGYSAEEANIQGALLKNGFNNISEAAATDGGVGAVAKNFEELGAKAGLSAEEIVRGSALIRNGFTDIASASKSGDMQAVVDDMNKLSGSVEGFPEGFTFRFNAEGNCIEMVSDAEDKVKQLQMADGTTIRVNADGNVEILDEAGEQTQLLKDTGAVALRVNADGNIELLDEAGEAVHTLQKETGGTKQITFSVIAGDSSGIDLAKEAEQITIEDKQATITVDVDASKVDEYEAPPKDGTAPYSVDPSKVNAWAPPKKEGVVTYKARVEGAVHAARGTNNAKQGLAIINDERGTNDPRELVEHKGDHYLFEGRDVPIYLDDGDKVYTASQTKSMLGGVPHFASGKNNEGWENAKSDRDHYRKTTFSIVSAEEELKWLEEMKNKFASDAEVIKEITEDIVSFTRQAWQETIDNMDFALQMGWKSEAEYYEELWQLRDNTPEITPDTKEWRDMTLQLNKYAQQNVKDANDVSKAWLDVRAKLNDWNEIGDSMGDALQRVANTNKQALADGLITADEYKETMLDTFESMADGYMSYSNNWISNEKKYHNMSASENVAAIDRQIAEIDKLAGSIEDMTEEEYVAYITVREKLELSKLDARSAEVDEWRDDASWHKQKADVYGWEALGDNEVDYWQRVYDREIENANDESLSIAEQDKSRRKADEALMEMYQSQGNSYDDMLGDVTDRISEIKDSFSQKTQALQDSWKVEDRVEDKTQVVADMEKYKNAVTIEGQEKYAQLKEELKRIEREEELYNLEQEQKAIIEKLEAEYSELEKLKETHLNELRTSATAVNNLLVEANDSITEKAEDFTNRIQDAIESIKPSVNVEMSNVYHVADATEGVMIARQIFNGITSIITEGAG